MKLLNLFIACFILLLASNSFSQANLTIQNNSMRSMTVKIMKGKGSKSSLFEKVSIEPYDSKVIYFTSSGYYFTKTKAVLKGKDPVFRKGKPFSVTNDDTGYSVLAITFSIVESNIPKATGGTAISKSEFDQD